MVTRKSLREVLKICYGKEHFVPLFYAMGTGDPEKKATLVHCSYRYGNLSQSIWHFG